MTTITISLGDSITGSPSPQYRKWYDGTTWWRTGVRGGNWVRDKALTALGFDGVEGPGDGTGDWENTLEDE